MAPLLAHSSAKIRSEHSPRRTRSADPISQAVRRSPPDGGTAEFLPHQFQIFHFVAARRPANPLRPILSPVLCGSLGFYLETNIPLLSSSRTVSNTGSGPKAIALASAIGTFVAAVAALVSVHMIIFDDSPPVIWNVGIGFGWALGVLPQLAAGTAARLGQYSSAPG
ncbi:MAG TPA: hypothetical protein VNV14_07030 [Opitutaceae bacterium]|nr:hypothetical protein [Opitutaceae bacterium]